MRKPLVILKVKAIIQFMKLKGPVYNFYVASNTIFQKDFEYDFGMTKSLINKLHLKQLLCSHRIF